MLYNKMMDMRWDGLFERAIRRKRGVLLVCIFLFFHCLVCGATSSSAHDAEGKAVFILGRFDGSSREFSPGSPGGPVCVSMAGTPDTHHWYAFQPISSKLEKGMSGVSSAPRLIDFTIANHPVAAYTMRLSLLIEHASVPGLHVVINGHEGMFYLDPKLDSRIGDGDAVSFPSFSQATIQFEIPGSFLHSGKNEIALSAVPGGEGQQIPDAGFNYDAIELTEGANKGEDDARVQLTPTIFYKQEGGQLQEGVDVTVRTGLAPVQSAALTFKDSRHPLSLDATVLWGEQRSRIYLPAFKPQARIATEWKVNGKTSRSEQMVDPAKRWTVYVVPHVHFDLGYTDYQAKVASVQSRIIDEALDLFSLHPEFRFSMDGMWSFEQFMENRTTEDKARALAAIKAERLFIPAQYSNELTGFASGETLIRSLYPAPTSAGSIRLL